MVRNAVGTFSHLNFPYPAGNNPCALNNGGCQHMCIITKVSETDLVGYRCACNIGWALSHDLKSCISEYL